MHRSYLFVPGTRPERFPKALASGADVVILDLEDAVPPEEKAHARELIAAWVAPERPVYLRINPIGTPWFAADLDLAARPGVAGVLLPKAEDGLQVAEVGGRLPRGTALVPLVETALGVWQVLDVARARGVTRLAFGSLDLQLDIHVAGDDDALLYARSRLVLASRIANLAQPIDGVTVAMRDVDRLRADVERSRRLGFGGKLCIHPDQVAEVNQGFMPSSAEVEWAKRVLTAAEAAGGAAVQVDGRMVDRPVIERARALLEVAERTRFIPRPPEG